jgi:hypothetical protein
MEVERARKIVADMMAHVWLLEGISKEEPPSLLGYTLGEMLDANRVVDEADRELMEKARAEHKGCDLQFVCAERLTAALYVAYHFAGDDAHVESVIPVAMSNSGVAVCVLQMKDGDNDNGVEPQITNNE